MAMSSSSALPNKGNSNSYSNQATGHGGNYSSSLSRALHLPGIVHWGNRRRVRFLRPHEEEEDEEKPDQKEEEEEEEDVVEEIKCTRSSGKRKLQCYYYGESSSCSRRRRSTQRPKPLKNSIHRWSAKRYQLAEENMLKIMRAKGAVSGNPILRPALRAEARKLIGDTGLLDHLLKHMAGKVASGGKDRFRRRHNSDGAMEYWIESADLVEIRRQAGVNDSYWVPPPGWKPGDNPTQDPVCATEIKQIKEEMVKIKKCIQELDSKRQEKEPPSSSSTRELMRMKDFDLGFKKPLEDLNPNLTITNVDLVEYVGSFLLMKKAHMEMEKKKAKIDKKFMEMSEYLNTMEEQVLIWESKGLLLDSEMWERNIESGEKSKSGDVGGNKAPAASKIQRLKSGFRICKPQGTFLWPSTVPNTQSDYPDVVQTPPSASPSTLSAVTYLLHLPQTPSGPHPPCPLKPAPARLGTLSSIPEGFPSIDTPLPKTPSTLLINLNQAPNDA
ncbi:hypothetical protein PanWU01x14_238150 [Parasponia andersonii]|uniref:PTC1-like winged helix-turn-helix domain-containing protein n=1 Tax=Parasponia andersonii TaxID=3476 RepID=A0A2P5BHP5_PARAD|nr:hypothetical protein PanWU01x14_238150 [Parasponia andersonii]